MKLPTETPVLIAGGGPAGLILALQLARHGTRCTLIERNLETTKWPKMDLTNTRSMELFNRLGITKDVRQVEVPTEYSLRVIFSTGLSEGGKEICKWDLPSPDDFAKTIQQTNDGSMPREPYQRGSQAVFEGWLRGVVEAEPMISAHWGVKFETHSELDDGVQSTTIDVTTGAEHTIRSQYLVGCDGAGSRVRKGIGSELIGGPIPLAFFLVHFKSRDLEKLHKQGQFWHIFFSHGAVIISQDEVDTWTTHLPIALDTDWESIPAEEQIAKVLGGSIGPCPIKIDEVIVKSVWRPNICIAERYASDRKRVFISGDSCHQNIPTGGYGMNTGVGDSFDLGWKLSAILNGWGGKHLLESYEIERKPVAARNIEHSGVHMQVHQEWWQWVGESGNTVIEDSEAGEALRKRITQQLLTKDSEGKSLGIELDYRYTGSPIVISDDTPEPTWNDRRYTPSTHPGMRAPHVFLADGKSSIYDLFGPEHTIVDFTTAGTIAKRFKDAALRLHVPLTVVHLPNEPHVASIWERKAVLVRPDDHIAWRSSDAESDEPDFDHILLIASGRLDSDSNSRDVTDVLQSIRQKGFTSTSGNEDQDKVEMRAEWQQ